MADRPDVIEEVSSSQGQQTHEVGESSRPSQTEEEIFRTQLVATMSMFTQEAIGETAAIRNCIKCLSRDVLKEREEAALLLFELSKYQPLCEKIGAESGAILVLVGIVSSNSENVVTIQKAEQILENLEHCEQNVRQMAVNGRVQPLLQRLLEGGEEVRLEMAMFLSELVLSREGKMKAAAMGGKTLVDMLESGYLAGREAALKCLCQLSNLEVNGKTLAEAGILRPLIRDLYVVGVNQLPMKLKEVAATTLANIVNSGVDLEKIPIDAEGNTLISEPTLHNLLHLVSNTGPAIEAKLLQVLVGLASSSRASGPVIMAIKSAGATVSLIQFLEAPQKELRANSIKLLYHLCLQMGQEVADSLRVTTGQLGTLVRLIAMSGVSEEQAAAARLLANLPTEDTQLTRSLLNEGALPMVVKQLDELRQGVSRIGAGRFVSDYKEGLVGILARVTYVMGDVQVVSLAQEYNLTALFTNLLNTAGLDEVQRLSSIALGNLSVYSTELSVPPKVIPQQSCCPCLFSKPPPKPTGLCAVHGGLCSSKQTFCLLEARALPSLVACLDHGNLGVVEAALKALLTLISNPECLHGGVEAWNDADAIQPILDIMREHKTERLRQLAVTAVEGMLRNDNIARTIATDGNVHTALVEAFKCSNNNTRHIAEKALKHLDKIPEQSGLFQTRKF
ncbi:hypothetical protein L7F22_061319 [Adiantum nelumboides]|nr:hypothetical protein [Adiantum nelumboides]